MAVAAIEELQQGEVVTFAKTVGESDVYLFAGLTGDLYQNHTNEEYMKTTRYGRRIAHGALLVGFMSAASSKVTERCTQPVVSYGYDRIRFIRPVYFGDTVTVSYRITEKDVAQQKVFAEVHCSNQRGELVAVATHILKFV
ncbi:MAG TPA: MaoC/PaaZ C-terminal domain-containing protein [Chloroflexota bacterium]|jgi:3-hydroxybutyryl-CoA dehydratase|nr:MaoC/PaaZ C-terminal domain-containing protein [Chloroflexota bacterium]HEX2186492.1 MaoC/PaaZ C-terminal domain-containing protein [Chloroflexota bacterium]